MPKNVGNLGKIIAGKGIKNLPNFLKQNNYD